MYWLTPGPLKVLCYLLEIMSLWGALWNNGPEILNLTCI